MKNFQSSLFILLCFLLIAPIASFAQNDAAEGLNFQVHRMLPFIQIDKEGLQEANTLNEINERFEADWVKEYISVEITATQGGAVVKEVGESDQLTQGQKALMEKADSGTSIAVNVSYMPQNNLSQNDPRELNFTFTTAPYTEALFPGGKKQCMQYLQEKAFDKISTDSHQGYDLTAVRFTIDQKGDIVDAHIFGMEYQKDRKKEIENLLVKTISEMPCWTPASYADGTRVSQEFVLTVGNLDNCMVPLLNIKGDL